MLDVIGVEYKGLEQCSPVTLGGHTHLHEQKENDYNSFPFCSVHIPVLISFLQRNCTNGDDAPCRTVHVRQVKQYKSDRGMNLKYTPQKIMCVKKADEECRRREEWSSVLKEAMFI
jgi:hypothetical protein